MTLIKSISGIRGTIGGKVGDNLTPVDAVKFASAYGTFLKNSQPETRNSKLKVVIGRDARISGPMIHNLVMKDFLQRQQLKLLFRWKKPMAELF
jgi:phosphomannomutase